MTVPTERSKAGPFDGDGSNTTFAFDFNIPSADELQVVVTSSDGTDTVIDPSLYTVHGTGLDAGGTVVYPVGGPLLQSDQKLTILRNPSFTQQVDLKSQSTSDPADFEGMVDRLTWEAQWLKERFGRTLTGSPAATGFDFSVPYGASLLIGWDPVLPKLALYPGPSTLLAQIAALKTATWKYRDDLGLKGDGTTDDSVTLVKAMQAASATNGAVFALEPLPGSAFYFRYPVVVPSGIQLLFSGGPIKLAKGASIRIAGDVAQTPATNPYRLTSNVTAGATLIPVDTSPQGGGAVNSKFAVGDRVVITGLLDGAGNALERGEHKVTAVDTAAITVSPAVAYSFQVAYATGDYEANWATANRTLITQVVQGALATDGAEGSNVVTLGATLVGRFAVGDVVMVEDDKVCSDVVVGASAERIHIEIAQIIDINGDGADTLTLNRRLERSYHTAFGGRVTMLEPARRAIVQGASIIFTESPDASPAPAIHTFEASRAQDCAFIACEVPNEDPFGSRGAMFRMYQCYRTQIIKPLGRNPKSLSGTDGRGVVDAYSTDCAIVDPEISGCKRNISFHGSTLGHADGVLLEDDREVSVGFAGAHEAACVVRNRSIAGGTRLAPGASTRTAVRFGDPANLVGPYRCIFEDGRVGNYKGTGSRIVQAVPGAVSCEFRDVRSDNIETLLWHEDSTLAPTTIVNGFKVLGCTVNTASGKVIDCHGGRNGSSTRTLQNLEVEIEVQGASKHITLQQIATAQLCIEIDKVTVDVTEPYGVKVTDVTGFELTRSDLRGLRAGVSLTNCPAAIVDMNRLVNFSGGTIVLQDGGGNTNMLWHFNYALGFVGTKDTPGTPSTGLHEWPLAITATADFVTLA